jgi:sporulation protein YlmC with PRC-barrel domain
MAMTFTRELEPLTSSGLELEDPSRDLRGRDVLDRDNDRIGTVADLLIDPNLRVARLLVLESGGGLLGMGKKQYLVPLEAVQDDGSQVRIDRPRDEITAEPEYHLADGEEEELQYMQTYTAYGIRPYWEVEAAPSSTTVEPGTGQT